MSHKWIYTSITRFTNLTLNVILSHLLFNGFNELLIIIGLLGSDTSCRTLHYIMIEKATKS